MKRYSLHLLGLWSGQVHDLPSLSFRTRERAEEFLANRGATDSTMTKWIIFDRGPWYRRLLGLGAPSH
jgi:hypothetical protein